MNSGHVEYIRKDGTSIVLESNLKWTAEKLYLVLNEKSCIALKCDECPLLSNTICCQRKQFNLINLKKINFLPNHDKKDNKDYFQDGDEVRHKLIKDRTFILKRIKDRPHFNQFEFEFTYLYHVFEFTEDGKPSNKVDLPIIELVRRYGE